MTEYQITLEYFKSTGSPFLLYDSPINPYEVDQLFPFFQTMIEGMAESVSQEGEEHISDPLWNRLIDGAIQAHEDTYKSGEPGHSREHFANNFLLEFFNGNLGDAISAQGVRYSIAALQDFLGVDRGGNPTVYQMPETPNADSNP